MVSFTHSGKSRRGDSDAAGERNSYPNDRVKLPAEDRRNGWVL